MNKQILEAVEAIRAEFQEKYGVEANISISVHICDNEGIDKDKADQIVREVAGAANHRRGPSINWATNTLESGRPFNVTAFYEPIPFTPEPEQQLEAEVL